ncbi:chromosome segregation protein SMC [Candidatus Woesearchaeota archaeon]|nr:chromosome segregation protein SMC [Candidatus Woesearchaeota archaeon]
MTQINKLVMHGFKSFAKRTELPFSRQFNIVLGPNGSGKSNILDGLCFVLGRISSKDLRTERLAHLIYNGGKTKQPASKGEVSIFFDNSDKLFPSDENFVKLSRIVKPSGHSVYRINDKARTRQEILDMMALAKVNPNGYNIVLQGDINRFVEMSSEERRQVIEEIAGIGVYEDKKKKALAELERVDGRIREAEILLAERKTHLKELKKDRDQALKYREFSNKIKQDEATHLHLQIKSKTSKKEGLDMEIAEHKKEIANIKNAIEQLKASVEEKKKETVAITEEVEQKGEIEQLTMHRSIEQMRVDIATANNRISMIDTELEKVTQRREQLKADLEGIDGKVADLSSKSAELGNEKAGLIEEKTRLERETKKLRGSGSDFAKVEEQLIKLDKESEALQAETQPLVERKQQLLREKDRAEFQIISVDESVKKLAEIEKSHKAELEQLDNKRKQFKKTVLELNKLLSGDSSISANIGDVKRRLYKANEDFTKLKMRHLASRERAFGSNAVNAILEQGQIKGIHGAVSQLGTVPEKYSAALEAAAGSRINSIVVETDLVAAKCINYLKSKKLGRATFLPLNKLKKDSVKKITEEGSHGMAVDIVSFEPKYKSVFDYVFGNTIVVDDIETARRIGIGGHRMVTLDGDLTEISGAMRGGFRQKTASVFQEKVLSKSLSEAEKNITELESSLSVYEKRKTESEEAIARLRETKAALEGEIIKAEKSLHMDSSDADVSRKNKEQLNSELKKISLGLSEVETKVTGMNNKIAVVKSQKLRLREQISSLGNPAVLAELTALEQKVTELNERIISIDAEISNSKVQSEEILAQEKTRIAQIIKQITKEEENFRAEKGQLASSTASKKKQLSETESKAAKFQAKNKTLFAKRTKLIEAIQGEEEKIIRKEEQINTTEVKINNITIKASEIAGEMAGLQEEFSQYSDVKLLENASEEQLKADISRYERMVVQMGNVNLKALEIYDDIEKHYSELLGKKDTLAKEKEQVTGMMNEIESRKTGLFMNTFNTLNANFKTAFTELSTKGSEAYLMLENQENIFEGGVRVRVRIAGEKFMDIRSLSGGETAMTALAFIFSIQEYEPASFYIFDEVDAALDKKNSEKFAQLIKKYSNKAQYIVISHNDNVITEANTLYGVSMDEHGMSNVVSLKV